MDLCILSWLKFDYDIYVQYKYTNKYLCNAIQISNKSLTSNKRIDAILLKIWKHCGPWMEIIRKRGHFRGFKCVCTDKYPNFGRYPMEAWI